MHSKIDCGLCIQIRRNVLVDSYDICSQGNTRCVYYVHNWLTVLWTKPLLKTTATPVYIHLVYTWHWVLNIVPQMSCYFFIGVIIFTNETCPRSMQQDNLYHSLLKVLIGRFHFVVVILFIWGEIGNMNNLSTLELFSEDKCLWILWNFLSNNKKCYNAAAGLWSLSVCNLYM